MSKQSSRNKTLSCTREEITRLSQDILQVQAPLTQQDIENQLILGDIFEVVRYLPSACIDLLILDPPYNLSKNFNGTLFKKKEAGAYQAWFQKVVDSLAPLMKPEATIYVCSDWRTSILIAPILEERFHVQNRITWEREKGRGTKTNWKNNTEDIWFCTNSDTYYFDVEAVKLKRKVVAPYRAEGKPKDWQQEKSGNYRLTHPSNIWTDVTIPFWSMPENTDHPTQKPEKLIAKLILASSRKGDFIFDPFLGSGTTAVVAKKLSRIWCGVDINMEYLCWACKRLISIQDNAAIQGYTDGVFWERNSRLEQSRKTESDPLQRSLL